VYEAMNCPVGLVAQARLWNISERVQQKYLDGVYITLQNWLPYVTTFQMTWGLDKVCQVSFFQCLSLQIFLCA
jgi:hypothetical protein